MTRKMGYRWHFRQVMATPRDVRDIGSGRSPRGAGGAAVPRAGVPAGDRHAERLNLHVLAALCDILDCGPGELIEPVMSRLRYAIAPALASGRRWT
jgi:hypothetical protein